jgi:CDGSH-type Zn-finger protein
MPLCDNRHGLVDYENDGRMSPLRSRDGYRDDNKEKLQVILQTDGPLLLSGPFEILDSNGMPGFRGDRGALCRCGTTKKSPFCDGSHAAIQYRAE